MASFFHEQLNLDFSDLGNYSILHQVPWSDTYWPSFQSGIARRWFSTNPQDFSYKLFTKEQFKDMSLEQMMQLSPAEK
jgi:hypothetical protein